MLLSVESFVQCSRLQEQIDAQMISSTLLCFGALFPVFASKEIYMSIPYVFNRTGETYKIPEWRLDRNDTPQLDSVPCDLVKHQGKWNGNMLVSHLNWEPSKSTVRENIYIHPNRTPIDFSIKFKIWSDLSCQVLRQDGTKTYSIDAMWRSGSWYTPAEWFTFGRWSLDFHRGGRWWSHLWWDVDFWGGDRKLHRFIRVHPCELSEKKQTQGFGCFLYKTCGTIYHPFYICMDSETIPSPELTYPHTPPGYIITMMFPFPGLVGYGFVPRGRVNHPAGEELIEQLMRSALANPGSAVAAQGFLSVPGILQSQELTSLQQQGVGGVF